MHRVIRPVVRVALQVHKRFYSSCVRGVLPVTRNTRQHGTATAASRRASLECDTEILRARVSRGMLFTHRFDTYSFRDRHPNIAFIPRQGGAFRASALNERCALSLGFTTCVTSLHVREVLTCQAGLRLTSHSLWRHRGPTTACLGWIVFPLLWPASCSRCQYRAPPQQSRGPA